MTAPLRDWQPDGLEIWPPAVGLSPELVAFHARHAHRLRLDAIHASVRRLLSLLGWKAGRRP